MYFTWRPRPWLLAPTAQLGLYQSSTLRTTTDGIEHERSVAVIGPMSVDVAKRPTAGSVAGKNWHGQVNPRIAAPRAASIGVAASLPCDGVQAPNARGRGSR